MEVGKETGPGSRQKWSRPHEQGCSHASKMSSAPEARVRVVRRERAEVRGVRVRLNQGLTPRSPRGAFPS